MMDLCEEQAKKREIYIQRRRSFYQRHRERICEQKRRIRLLNPDKVHAADKKYRQNNKQKISESNRRWYLGRSQELKDRAKVRDRERYKRMRRIPAQRDATLVKEVKETRTPVMVSKPQSFKNLQSAYIKSMRKRCNEVDDTWRSQFSWAIG